MTVRVGNGSARRGRRIGFAGVVLGLAAMLGAASAHAQFAVIDVAALKQMIQQALYWQQQLTRMREQLAEVKGTREALTGVRGMERVLPIAAAARNYLPADFAGLDAVLSAGALARDRQRLVASQAVLSDAWLSGLPAALTDVVRAGREASASRQTLARSVYAELSGRFARLDQLRSAIAGAADGKAIAELTARIGVEQTMLANDQAKLTMLAQVMSAEEQARRQQVAERALARQGQFATRFQPVP